MGSNYPPGVTGNEYEIGGAQSEWEAEARCPFCDVTSTYAHEYHYSFGTRAFCETLDCPGMKGFEVEPDEPEYDPYSRYGTVEHEEWLIEMERQEG